ncbi:MAG: hypothetical protein LBF68_06400 [Christensenellaceae bacterium]|jgi:hypothetical protein|nr:hypothetical protein [Christensenellaceae bacterium]
MNISAIISNIAASIADILIGVGAGLLVVLSIVTAILRKKKGKTSCGCDCPGCNGQCDSMKPIIQDESGKSIKPE